MLNNDPHSVMDSGGKDLQEIESYIKSLKRSSRTQDEPIITRPSELWMLPVPVHSSYLAFMIRKLILFYFTGRNGENPC